MKSANKSNISDIFFLNQRTPLSEIKNYSISYDYYEEQQQQISVLEKKLFEQQEINYKQTEEMNQLRNDIKIAKTTINSAQSQLDTFYLEIKEKQDQLLIFEKQIREKEMHILNKELSLMNKQTQTEETGSEQLEVQENQQLDMDIDIAKILFSKRIQQEYQILKDKQRQLDARENGIIFRENKIKEFMSKISQSM